MRSTSDPRRMLVTVAVRDYPGGDTRFRDGMDASIAAAVGWWCDPDLPGGGFVHRIPARLTTRDDIDAVLRDSDLRTLKPDDVAVLLVTGHGITGESRQHYLLLPDSDEQRLLATAYPTAQLVTALLASYAEHVLVLVSSCYAGALHEELARLRKDLPPARQALPTIGVFTCAEHDERPRVRELAELLDRAREQLRTTTQIDREHLTFDEFGAELARAARRPPALLEPIKLLPLRYQEQPSRCLPNPGYRPRRDLVLPARRQVAVTEADLAYWRDKASGRVSDDDTGWYFSGRRALMARLVAYLREETGIMVVTGVAGSGKSAIIARAVTLSDPTFRRDPRFADILSDVDDELMPPEDAIDVAVLARNKDPQEIAEQVVAASGVTPTGTTGPERLTALTDQIRSVASGVDGRRLTVVVDGVDEARRPDVLLVDLLGPLARAGIRLVLGLRTRASTPESATSGSEPSTDLLALVRQVAGTATVTDIRTDGPETVDDITTYVTALLGADYPRLPEVAGAIAAHVTPSFLDARLAARRLRDTPQPQDPADPSWLASLREGTVALLRDDLREVAGPQFPLPHLLAALRAPAFALGAGLPWSDIWPAVAEAVLGEPFPEADDAIRFVLHSRLAGYLAGDTEDEHVVHRLSHERLADVLRDHPDRLIGEP